MLSCSEVTRLHASGALPGTPLVQRVMVRLHFLICAHCRRYERELRLIAGAARDEAQRRSPDRAQLEALESSLRKRLRVELATRSDVHRHDRDDKRPAHG